MRKGITAIVLGLLLSLAAGSTARADNAASFKFTNNTSETIFMYLWSKSRPVHWPDHHKRWVLNPGKAELVVAGFCDPGEKICYGGGNGNKSRTWGDGLDGKHGCANCCIQCGGSHGWILTEHVDPPGQSHTVKIDDGPALVPVEE
jgi:hypothetical protein